MIPYLILMAIPTVFSFIAGNKNDSIQKILLWFTGVIYIFFIGLRDEVGADWNAYLGMYDYIKWSSFKDGINHTEFGFSILNWLMVQIDADVYGINIVCTFIFVSGLIKFARKMPLPWLALISVTAYLVIAIGMSAVSLVEWARCFAHRFNYRKVGRKAYIYLLLS
jgi:hypothetical protein